MTILLSTATLAVVGGFATNATPATSVDALSPAERTNRGAVESETVFLPTLVWHPGAEATVRITGGAYMITAPWGTTWPVPVTISGRSHTGAEMVSMRFSKAGTGSCMAGFNHWRWTRLLHFYGIWQPYTDTFTIDVPFHNHATVHVFAQVRSATGETSAVACDDVETVGYYPSPTPPSPTPVAAVDQPATR